MRRVLSSLMVLAPASPALSAVQRRNHPSKHMFSAGPTSILRRLLPAFALMSGLLSPALAADYDLPILRGSSQPVAPLAPVTTVGPATFTRWSGFYFGGDFGLQRSQCRLCRRDTAAGAFQSARATLENVDAPSQWAVLGRGSGSAFGGGGFIGYNTQWQDLIIGVEGNYTRTNLVTDAPTTPIGRITSAGGAAPTVSFSAAPAHGSDGLRQMRARAGWILGDFLPYGFAGFAVGRGKLQRYDAGLWPVKHGDAAIILVPTTAGPALTTPTQTAPGKATRCCRAFLSAAALIGR